MRHERFLDPLRWSTTSVPYHLSARGVQEPWLGALVIVVAALPLIWGPLAWALIPVFLAVVMMRATALLRWRDRPDPAPVAWPRLSVIVPAYGEPELIRDLACAMSRIDYPDLEIVLALEDCDAATRNAAVLHWPYRVVVVPDGRPRTKPRAVNYALTQTSGSVVVVFDVEDRPAPDQARKAVARLLADPRCAVVQGVLACDHDGPAVARLWGLEYAVLFQGVLPFLSRFDMPFLLGGTTQYLRRDVLEQVGAFDAHNVTEDCDLAVRLARAGWKSSVVLSVTGEEAPVTVSAWIGQRSRWLKGFMQTTLVHGLLPRSRHLRWRDRVALFLQMPGQVLCVASHPVGIVVVAQDPTSPLAVLFSVGYLVTIATFATAAHRAHVRVSDALRVPAYLFLHAFAVVVAVVELVVAPSFWRKTQHAVARRRAALAESVQSAEGPGGLRTDDGATPTLARAPAALRA